MFECLVLQRDSVRNPFTGKFDHNNAQPPATSVRAEGRGEQGLDRLQFFPGKVKSGSHDFGHTVAVLRLLRASGLPTSPGVSVNLTPTAPFRRHATWQVRKVLWGETKRRKSSGIVSGFAPVILAPPFDKSLTTHGCRRPSPS
jgi:hypothetical protein